uniref:glucuronosyltransferase n=1 Tax=Malurus cyaneus samueli TaxID=2593467 RepID=A0A8C5U0D5_9PASS
DRCYQTVVLLLSLLGLAAAGRLLVVPVDGSHWLSMREVLDILAQRGHEVVVVAPEASLRIKPSKNFVVKKHWVPLTQEDIEKEFQAFLYTLLEEGSFLERFFKIYEGMKRLGNLSVNACELLLQDKELIRYLEETEFDALLTDPVIPCGPILAEHLSLPSVYFLRGIPCGLDFEATQCPNPPSYVPEHFHSLTDHMTFPQRVKNLLFEISHLFLCNAVFNPYGKLASEFLQREVTVPDLLRQASIWLMKLDFVLHYPKPLMPNMVLISGVNCAYKKLNQVGHALFVLVILAGFEILRQDEKMHLRLLSLLPHANFSASSPGYFQRWNPEERGRLGSLSLRSLCLQPDLEKNGFGDGYVRPANKLREPEGALVTWQVTLKGDKNAKGFVIKYEAYLTHHQHLSAARTLLLVLQPFISAVITRLPGTHIKQRIPAGLWHRLRPWSALHFSRAAGSFLPWWHSPDPCRNDPRARCFPTSCGSAPVPAGSGSCWEAPGGAGGREPLAQHAGNAGYAQSERTRGGGGGT